MRFILSKTTRLPPIRKYSPLVALTTTSPYYKYYNIIITSGRQSRIKPYRYDLSGAVRIELKIDEMLHERESQ